MNKLIRIVSRSLYVCVCAGMLAHAGLANATPGEAQNATLLRMQISRGFGNFVFIHLATTPTVRAACATNAFWHFTLSLSDEAGKNMYAQLLVAYAAGQRVHIGGTDTCSEYGNSESVDSVSLDVNAM
jgi:hypothetical protein